MATTQSGMFVNYGPMQISIQAVFADKQSSSDVQVQAAGQYAKQLLHEIAQHKEVAKLAQQKLPSKLPNAAVLRRMVDAVRQAADPTLTPMAAVAGTIADMIADDLAARGALKVIVNNGGDIAIRLQEGQTAKVGVAVSSHLPVMTTVCITKESGIGGIATSGIGGRSLTKGIATAAVVAARTAGLADACATSVGNAVYTAHPHIRLMPAEALDPNTDIRGHFVVKEVGILPLTVIQKAIYNGKVYAQKLLEDEIILKAAIYIEDWSAMIPEVWLNSEEQLLYK
ncbi:hypothetical protein [Anaerosinus massiliensis]|uniref:hypothetical protein n=1 Tax=Massilibacillus massiliensis TaxID=1806837 RepID=UPI000B275ACB|nr:hypothetical protein [Massilibacillus massiliensis]